MNPLFLVLDQGGGSSRALLFDNKGHEQGRAQVPVSTTHPAPAQVEQSPDQLLHSLHQCIDQLLSSLSPSQQQRVRSWGLACQRSNLLAIDAETRQPLTPVLSWQDLRARQSNWDSELVTLIHQHNGLFPSDHHGAVKLRWCMQQPELLNKARQQRLLLTPLSGFLTAGLTQSVLSSRTPLHLDHACAQRTLLWNRQTLDWDPQLLAQFNVPLNTLPTLRHCEADWGVLRWRELKIRGGFVGGDQGCAHFALGQPKPQQLNINLGTGAFISLALNQSLETQHRLLTSLASSHQKGADWMLEGTINGAASALQWLQRQPPQLNLDALQRRPLRSARGLFINAVSGLGSPFWRSDLTSRFIDCDTDSDRYSALVESILFLICENLQAIPPQLPPLEQINLSGGLSAIPGLAQRLADLSDLPVKLIQQSEATARGMAFLLAGRPADWSRCGSEDFHPQPATELHDRYRRWQQLLQQALEIRTEA